MRRAALALAFVAGCGAQADFEVVDGAPPEVADLGPGEAVAAVPSAEEREGPGFLGRALSRAEDATDAPTPEDAAIAATASAASSEDAPTPRRGLFGGLLSRVAMPAAQGSGEDTGVTPDALTYGQIIPACDVRGRALGQEVARFPETGAGYRLFDTDPSAIALRPHYITGFRDGCPRKFLAALALFGGADAYETTRFKDGRDDTAITETDTRYKAIRAQVCGRPVGEPCPERRFDALARSAVFVSVYSRFGTNPTWADVLIYEGEVVAKDFKHIR